MFAQLFLHRWDASRIHAFGNGTRPASIGLAALLALWGAILSAPAIANTSEHALPGTWRITVSVGESIFPALYTFSRDGTLTESDEGGFHGQACGPRSAAASTHSRGTVSCRRGSLRLFG
jgi:hypothetical protein